MSTSNLDVEQLLLNYKKTADVSIRNEIILKYSNLVRCIVVSMRNMFLKYAEVDDVINECFICLISAVDSFDLDKNVKFETYASIRIKGAVIDFIRKQDFIPRSVRSFSKNLEVAYSKLYNTLRREPTNEELAKELQMPIEKYQKMLSDSACANTLSFEEIIYENNIKGFEEEINEYNNAEEKLLKQEFKSILSSAIDILKEKERLVISLYYYEKLKFSDIAKVLGLSESRVCQIHSKAIVKLKMQINIYLDREV